MSILKNGTILNRNQYRITKFIAQGGFGITYLAEEIGYYKQSGYGEEYVQSRNPETVVIKELYYNDYCQRDEQTGLISISNVDKKQEFQKLVKNQMDEGKTIRGLQHKNIIRTRDIFHENDTAYMVMDYVESTDLEEMLKSSGFLDKERSMKYISQILSAVDYIHTKIDKKILHLDISPSNILIDKSNDDAILIDFGSALSYDNVANNITSTTSQIVTGRKKHYSPNEQGDIDNLKSFDATFDTYAIGATLYHLLSGEKPPLSSMVSTGREKIIPPSEIRKDNVVSEYLDAVIMKSIAPFYRERYASAEIFAEALAAEPQYNAQVSQIKNLVSENKLQEAGQQIRQTTEKFLKTAELQKLETEIRERLENEKKEREYGIFLKKGNNMFAAGELEMALEYYGNAKEIFPENPEILDKIKICEDYIEQKKQAEISQKTSTSSTSDIFSEETELLTPQSKIQENKSQNFGDATELMSSPKAVEKPEIHETPKPEPIKKESIIPAPANNQNSDQPASANAKTKSGKGILIGGIAAALIGISGILYATGAFESKTPKQTISDNTENIPSAVKDSVQEQKEEAPALSQNAIDNSAENEPEAKPVGKTEDTSWKNKFETTYSVILSSEDSQNPQASIAKYKALLKTLPANASSERERVNYRILKLSTKKEEKKIVEEKTDKKTSDVDLAQYNKDLQWAKNMINVDGCDGCRENDVCRDQVTARLKNALSKNPNGSEAKALLNCLK